MKFTAILLTSACLQVAAGGHGQGVTISVKNAPLTQVFSEIKKQTGYTFMYTESILKEAKKVTMEVKNTSLEQALIICFAEQPFTYVIIEKTIVIKPKQTPEVQSGDTPPSSLPIDIRGRVVNENNEPVVGASVRVKGTNIGTTTNENGEFSFSGLDENATLVFSGTNIETFETKLQGRTKLDLTAKIKENVLGEVIINKGYYTEKQRLSVSNVGRITAKDIEKQPINNPLLALQGRVPGVFIQQGNGLPGTSIGIMIQGRNSIGRGNNPLYVIDGVPYISQLLPNMGDILRNSNIQGSLFGGQNGNPMSFINSSDIESISVLKDADATAIYGSRAANGAILITTKKGNTGSTKVDINLQQGWGKVTQGLDVLNLKQYLEMRNEAIKNDGGAIDPNSDHDLALWDTTRSTDWQKELIGRTAKYTNLGASVSGGTSTIQYLAGFTYRRETTVFPGDFDDQKGNLHFSFSGSSPGNKFKFRLSGSYMVDHNRLPNNDFTQDATYLPPNAPSLYKTDGTLNWELNNAGRSTWTNPLAKSFQTYSNKTNNLIGNATISYRIIPNLEFSSSFGYTNLQSDEIVTFPSVSFQPFVRPFLKPSARYGDNGTNSWNIEPQLNYNTILGKGKIEALVGTTIQQNNGDGIILFGTGYTNDLVLKDIRFASTVSVNSTVNYQYKYNAVFGRLNYNLADKYILNLSARRDGSSRFGEANQFHNFGSVGGAWIFSNEPVFKDQSFFSFGKLKGSYGTTGNDQIGDYNFLSLYNAISAGVPYQGVTGISPTNHSNPYLQWEETRKLNGGIDLGFLNDKILLNVNYFLNRSSNQLIDYTLPALTGFYTVQTNLPAIVQNTGLEVMLNTINIKSSSFGWSSSFNITIPKNKLVSFPDLASSFFASSLVVGQPLYINKVFHFSGINATSGIYQFRTSQGNLTSNPNGLTDRTEVINLSPKYYGGFENTFTYKGMELDVLFQFTKQIGRNYVFGSYPGGVKTNQPVTVLDRWQNPGSVGSIQKYNADYSLYEQNDFAAESDAAFSDASYIRLKNLSLSWTLPQKVGEKYHLRNTRIYLHGQNLLTFTKYKGRDPETLSTTTLPPLRIWAAGIQIGL